MKSFRIAALAGAIASLVAGSALACTTVVVGQDATSDGSILIARSADSSALKAQHLVIHPAKKGQKGMYRTADHHGANNFEYPLPENAMRFTTVPNWQTQVHGATGWNEAGVGFSGTESIFARDDALKIDPYVEDPASPKMTFRTCFCQWLKRLVRPCSCSDPLLKPRVPEKVSALY
ncbi:C69 family dipeptidase [Sutterella wadsworthensis]|uniref:C69 family dipeptidase n=1 Tax=Sutterella wadsworthensis TaxID=40545 RepID=UPI003079BB5C